MIAKRAVSTNPIIAWVRELATIAWCDQVTVQPDNKRIMVFKNGISQGLKTFIPLGGQIEPMSTVGAKLLWKKAQKKAKKKSISETINSITP
jgi:hypothetical protein